MEDFRNKIKNYKAIPNDDSWERMLIKKEKRKFKKVKNLFYALLALNILGFAFIGFQYLKTDTQVEPTTIIDDSLQKELEKQNILSLNEIKNLNQERRDFINQIKTLQTSLDQTKRQHASQIKDIKFSLLESKNTISSLLAKQSMVAPPQSVETKNLVQNEINIDPNASIPNLTPLLYSNNNYIQKYLLGLASDKKPIIPFFQNNVVIENDIPEHWYLSLGTSIENNVTDQQRNLSIGLYRSVHRLFDLGVLVEISKNQERGEFKIFNDIRDFRTENEALFFARYKAYRLNKLLLYVDAGIGYRYGNISSRQGQIINNELEYYNNAVEYKGIAYQFALGAMYELAPRFTLGTRFYINGNLHSNINLNYKF